jgi:hypothetical protein
MKQSSHQKARNTSANPASKMEWRRVRRRRYSAAACRRAAAASAAASRRIASAAEDASFAAAERHKLYLKAFFWKPGDHFIGSSVETRQPGDNFIGLKG